MKKYLGGLALAAAAVGWLLPAASEATLISGFTGPLAPATWTTSITGNLPPGDGGSATFTSTLLTLVGGDNPLVDPSLVACTGALTGFAGPCQISVTHGKVGASDTVSFHWSYTTTDISAETDIFGVLVDGVFTDLSDPGGAYPTQSGDYTLNATNSFAFVINCTDCVGGAATAQISAFQAAVVPEPETIALVGFGVVAIYASRRRRPSRRGMLSAA